MDSAPVVNLVDVVFPPDCITVGTLVANPNLKVT